MWQGRSAEERFDDSYVPEPNSGCWLWERSTRGIGYGRLYVRGVHVSAHRFSFERYVGPIPTGMLVCHKCDTPACVNPNHLFLGDDAVNSHDRDFKGRQVARSGEANGNAALTAADVGSIRALLKNSAMTQREIARRFGVSQATVNNIHLNKRWADHAQHSL